MLWGLPPVADAASRRAVRDRCHLVDPLRELVELAPPASSRLLLQFRARASCLLVDIVARLLLQFLLRPPRQRLLNLLRRRET